MDRRKFVRDITLASVAVNPFFSNISFAALPASGFSGTGAAAPLDRGTLDAFKDFLQWMKNNNWLTIVKNVTGLDLDINDPQSPDLFKAVPIDKSATGLEDFIGDKLIEPGVPARSLLYHLLASPRVINTAGEYPSLEQIDLVENYLYGSLPVQPEWADSTKMVLAIFAYEYRPACKTPHGEHADMVFARTGFARIGTQPMSAYDALNRCYTNRPTNPANQKEIAVTPARYGLFLAKRVPANQVSINTLIKHDSNYGIQFLMPVKKLFTGDPFAEGQVISFTESHVNEKLLRLWQTPGLGKPRGLHFDTSRAPFVRRSSGTTGGVPFSDANYDRSMVDLTAVGSSVLLTSAPAPSLVRRAFQVVNGTPQRLRLLFPAVKMGGPPLSYSNRRYTSYKSLEYKGQLRDAYDAVRAKVVYPNRVITDYEVPRNAPMFVNMRERVSEQDGNTITYLSPDFANLQGEVNKTYWAGLFEDSICDGCISAKFSSGNLPLGLSLLPAFSVVTAPDFFPSTESYDLEPEEDMFLVGGTEDMSGGRKAANPDVKLPGSQLSAFPLAGPSDVAQGAKNTIAAIISAKPVVTGRYNKDLMIEQADRQTRSNFLPDCATKIFFPGWDITYSSATQDGSLMGQLFYATYALGSPFVEDSKLCAAVNGMWVAASPDAARTFRNSLTSVPTGLKSKVLPPTAIPLLDKELGFHKASPAVVDHQLPESWGWDGEQGPFLHRNGSDMLVNFTDVGRADYVHNALNGSFDMSQMRELTTKTIKYRMESLGRCYQSLGFKAPYTQFWLVGCEQVVDWAAAGIGSAIAINLYGTNNNWATACQLPTPASDGFLLVLVQTTGSPTTLANSRRMEQPCDIIHIFQTDRNNIAHCILTAAGNWIPQWI